MYLTVMNYELYWTNLKATEHANVICKMCNMTFNKKVNSIRVNIRNNGFYRCQRCQVATNKDLVASKLRKENSVRSITNAICTRCNNKILITNRNYSKNIERNKEFVCKTCH